MDTILQQQAAEINKLFLEPIAKNEKLSNRLYKEKNRLRNDGEYQRDYTRILYGRYIIITQS